MCFETGFTKLSRLALTPVLLFAPRMRDLSQKEPSEYRKFKANYQV